MPLSFVDICHSITLDFVTYDLNVFQYVSDGKNQNHENSDFLFWHNVGGSEGTDSTAHMDNPVRVVTACHIGL